MRSVPFANALVEGPDAPVGVISIYSPEYAQDWDEKYRKNRFEAYGVKFPTYLDLDRSYMTELGAAGWPQFYVVDKSGNIRGEWLGEVHDNTPRAWAIRGLIDDLIEE